MIRHLGVRGHEGRGRGFVERLLESGVELLVVFEGHLLHRLDIVEDLARLADLLSDLFLFFLHVVDVALQIRDDALQLLGKDMLLL